MNHTPGPWTVFKGICRNDHPDTSADVRGPEGEHVADCGCAPAAIDNARLIAAAPDLLDACRAWVDWYNFDSTEQKRDDAFYASQAVLARLALPNPTLPQCPGYRRSHYGAYPTCKYCGRPESEHG